MCEWFTNCNAVFESNVIYVASQLSDINRNRSLRVEYRSNLVVCLKSISDSNRFQVLSESKPNFLDVFVFSNPSLSTTYKTWNNVQHCRFRHVVIFCDSGYGCTHANCIKNCFALIFRNIPAPCRSTNDYYRLRVMRVSFNDYDYELVSRCRSISVSF